MSFSALGTYACRALQQDYVDYFGKNAAQFKTMGSTALIKWLLSPQNTRGFKQINVETVPGKKRPVVFMYDNPFCFEIATPAANCNTTRTVLANPAQETVYDLTGDPFRVVDGDGAPQALTFAQADLKKYCTTTDESYIKNQILRYLKRFEEQLDARLSELLNASVGTDAAGNAIVSLPFFTKNTATNSNALNQDAIFWMDQNYRDIGGDGQYAVIGGKLVNMMISHQKWSALNQAGIDLGKVADEYPFPFYDRNMDSILGQDTFLQLSPGAAQLVYFNEYMGENKRGVTDLYSQDTVISPLTGLPIDFEWTFDYNCKVWKFEAFLHAELAINLPGGCGLPTSNGILKYKDCSNAMVLPTCPEVPVG